MNFNILEKSILPLFFSTLALGLFYWQFTYAYAYIIDNFTNDKLSTLYAHLFIYIFLVHILFVSLNNVSFNLPTFESANEVFKRTDSEAYYKSDENNNTKAEKSRIYSMLSVDDGILIGGSFASVNGVEKHNLVKLNLDGTIDSNFNSNVGGTVNKIIKIEDSFYIAGTIGSYNNNEAYGLIEIDANGKSNNQFLPFQDYMFTKINDMIQLDDENIMLAGTFIKDALEEDQNKSQEELIELSSTIIILNKEGFVNEKLTAKFSDLKNEVFALFIDQGKVYIAGDFHLNKENKEYNNLVSYDLNGNFDANFQIEKLLGMIFDVAVHNDKVLFAGDFLIDADDNTRSFYIVDKLGKTIKVDNMQIYIILIFIMEILFCQVKVTL